MKVNMELQEILNVIHRNQQQIDLLTVSNTQHVKFLLQTGMIQTVNELGFVPGQTLPLSPTSYGIIDDQPQTKRPYVRRLNKAISQEQTLSKKASKKTKGPDRLSAEGRKRLSLAMKKRFKEWGSVSNPNQHPKQTKQETTNPTNPLQCVPCNRTYKTMNLRRRHDRQIHGIYLHGKRKKPATQVAQAQA